jgi:hypothetical protein
MTPEEIRKQMMGSAGFNVAFPLLEEKKLCLSIGNAEWPVSNPKEDDILKAIEPYFTVYKLDDDEYPDFLLSSYEDDVGRWDICDYNPGGKELYAKNVPPETIKSIFIKYLKGDASWRDGVEWNRDVQKEQEDEELERDLDVELVEAESNLPNDSQESDEISQNVSPVTGVANVTVTAQSFNKNYWIAIALAVVFGPFGLLYISWKRALVVLAIWIVAVALFHNPIMFWIVLSAGSVVLMGTGSRNDG